MRITALVAAVLSVLPAAALEVPAGTSIEVRLQTKVSTQSSKANDPVSAVVIAPVMTGGEFAVPAGAVVRGSVQQAVQSAKPDQRSLLVLQFTGLEFGGAKHAIASQVAGVDNARETVDAQGRIQGILASETLTSQIDSGIQKLAQKYSGFADVLETVKSAVLQPAESDITYDAGVEMELKLTVPLALAGAGGAGPADDVQRFADEAAVAALVRAQPFQTMAQSPAKPSDITNVMLIGTEEALQQAFTAAGWSSAAGLTTQSKLETFRAIAEQRGYKEAPVSVLLLDGHPPDLVFEKLNNTFAQRHHLRIWRRPVTFLGRPVWVLSATHDIGIAFSEQDRTFIHKIDSSIDRERAKVVLDLIFTRQVQSIALVDRPRVPTHGQNATGDALDTDGAMAVMLLK